MTYWGELRRHWRPLLAASLGSGTSLPLFAYTNSVFAPHLVKAFGWSRAQFALIGMATLTTLFVLPFVGRFTDRFGVRPVALAGTILVPISLLGYAVQSGAFAFYVAVFVAVLAIGSLTSPLVYTRLIAENFDKARGLALTIVNCVPAALAMILAPLLNLWIEALGWRSAYVALAALTLLAGMGAIALIPSGQGGRKRGEDLMPSDPVTSGSASPDTIAPAVATPPFTARQDYRTILGNSTFWIIFVGMFLCLLQLPLHSSQMNLMLVDNGISTQAAANIVPIYALGTIVGRIACGLALDRFATPPVTALSLILPALGYLVLAGDWDSLTVIGAAMFMIGLSIGAESDLISFLVARYYKLRIYATTLGLVYCTSFLASATGALGISYTLATTGHFAPYLYLVAGTVAVGSLLFLLLPWRKDQPRIG